MNGWNCGPATARALEDFQRNSGLTADGVCGVHGITDQLAHTDGTEFERSPLVEAREQQEILDEVGSDWLVAGKVRSTCKELASLMQK